MDLSELPTWAHGYSTSSHPSVQELKRIRHELRNEIARLDLIVLRLDEFIEKKEKLKNGSDGHDSGK